RGLAGAVRSDQGTDLTFADVEGGAVERRDPAEAQGHVPDGQDGVARPLVVTASGPFDDRFPLDGDLPFAPPGDPRRRRPVTSCRFVRSVVLTRRAAAAPLRRGLA